MLGCIESLSKRSLIKDNEYEFYDKYLSNYESYDIQRKEVKAKSSDHIIFSNLNNLYSIACSIPAEQRTVVEEYADSFAFFVSVGVIKLVDSYYYINLESLAKFKEKYEKLNDKGISYTMKRN